MIMPSAKKRMKPRDELLLSGLMLLALVVVWFMILYNPVVAKNSKLKQEMRADKDSVEAIEHYKVMEVKLNQRAEELSKEIVEWDRRFPPRNQLVPLARRIISFCHDSGIRLIEMKPSLFELYALERAGNMISGRYVYKQLVNLHMRGRYLDFGRMLERIDALPFNITITDIKLNVLPGKRPQVDIELNIFLYVHR